MGLLARAVAMSMSVAVLAGCASVFKMQVLYEAPQPGATDSRCVMRLEKEQNPILGTKEEFPARRYNISETRVREMMTAMYRRFFKDPATFVPPNETFGDDTAHAVMDSGIDSLIGAKENPGKDPRTYRPKLREDGHPASMSQPKPVFTPKEIDALAPEIVRAFAELRKGEHLTLRTRAFDSQGRGGPKWNESQDATSVAIRFRPAGKFLGVAHGAAISWDFYTVHGLEFRGKGGQIHTYSTHDDVVSEEYDFLAVFPRKESDTDYWSVVFPAE
jgi:hypothetical protein